MKKSKKNTPADSRPDAIPQEYWPLERNRNAGEYDKTSRKADEKGGKIVEKTIVPRVQ